MTLTFRTLTYPGYNLPGQGRHATELVMAVVGPAGAIAWRMTTGVTPKHPYGERPSTIDHNLTQLYNALFDPPGDMGVSAHSEMTIDNCAGDEYPVTENCDFLDGRACVCTYQTGLKGSELFPAFACEGFAGVEKILTTIYKEHYNEQS